MKTQNTLEVEGSEKPALIAENPGASDSRDGSKKHDCHRRSHRGSIVGRHIRASLQE